MTGYRSTGDRPEGELRVEIEGTRPGRVVLRPGAEPMPVAGALDAVFTPAEGPATTLVLRSRYMADPDSERGQVLGFSERTFSHDATHWLRIETTFQPDGTAATVRLILPPGEGEVPAPGVEREAAGERTWSLMLPAEDSIARGDPWLTAAGVGPLATDARLARGDPARPGALRRRVRGAERLRGGAESRARWATRERRGRKDLNQYVGDCVGATNGCRQDILHCFQNALPDIDDGLLSPRAAQCTPNSAACATFFVTCGCKDTYEGFTRACNAECGPDACADTCRCGGGCSQDGTCTCFDEVCCRDFICGCDRGEDFWGRPACAVGDPHLTTHDGTYFDYQGVGEYVLVAADGLTIQGRTRPGETCGGFAFNERLAVGVNGIRVEVDPTGAWLDGEPLPHGLVGLPGFVVDAQEGLTRVETEAGDLIVARRVGDWLDVAVRLDPRRRGLVSGRLGDFDGDPENDLRGRGGEASDEALTRAFMEGVMAGSWRVMDGESLFTYGEGESTASHTDLGYPPRAAGPRAARARGAGAGRGRVRRPGPTDAGAACELHRGRGLHGSGRRRRRLLGVGAGAGARHLGRRGRAVRRRRHVRHRGERPGGRARGAGLRGRPARGPDRRRAIHRHRRLPGHLAGRTLAARAAGRGRLRGRPGRLHGACGPVRAGLAHLRRHGVRSRT